MATEASVSAMRKELERQKQLLLTIEAAIKNLSPEPQENSYALAKASNDSATVKSMIVELEGKLRAST